MSGAGSTVLRESTGSDRAALRALHASAFGPEEGPAVADLVEALLDDGTARPRLSLVAEERGEVVGHVLFTAVRVPGAEGEGSARILAPVAVSPERQGAGVGGRLIRAGLERLDAEGVELVFVLGHPGYYPRFGFRAAGALGLDAPYTIPPEHAEAWRVRAGRPGALARARGRVRCADALMDPLHWSA